jgi:hypothetical protein
MRRSESVMGCSNPRLANNWPASRVMHALAHNDKQGLIQFLQARYTDRFFDPISQLIKSAEMKGSGFSIMALCCLLIESIEALWDGLPSSNRHELKNCQSLSPPPEYEVPEPEWPRSNEDVFTAFFCNPRFRACFGAIDGSVFYKAIRNGLLHQAQTKGGWIISATATEIWDANGKTINRDRFFEALLKSFDAFLDELRSTTWREERWRKANRKIWWLIRLS